EHLVALLVEEFGQMLAVLAGDARDECACHTDADSNSAAPTIEGVRGRVDQ
ncbi:MAG: hypothetical protein RL743_889, partial [Actinomycetota bacterium]